MAKSKNLHRGSALDEFQSTAIEEVIAWQIGEAMQTEGLTKTAMAARMNTSRRSSTDYLIPAMAT